MGQFFENHELEREITELEKEVGWAIYPVSRSDYKDAESYRGFLAVVKMHKDDNTGVWSKMANWD